MKIWYVTEEDIYWNDGADSCDCNPPRNIIKAFDTEKKAKDFCNRQLKLAKEQNGYASNRWSYYSIEVE